MASSVRYPALQGFANIVRSFALIVALAIVGLGAVGVYITVKENPDEAFIGGAVALSLGALAYIGLGAGGDLAQLLIDVESHLRRLETPAAGPQPGSPPTP